MTKLKKKREKKQKNVLRDIDVSYSINLPSYAKNIILCLLIILSVALPYYYLNYAFSANKYYSFPLDDPWIHMQFAKNFAEFGSYSYYKNELVTAGSTSPVYTFILTSGFLITKSEMPLSYIMGILFFLLSAVYFYKLSNDTFIKENWLAIAASLIFVLDKWLNFISVTGMETTLHIFLIIACFFYYHRKNAAAFALTLGLTIWTRPDAIALFFAILLDYFLLFYLKKNAPKENVETILFSKQDLMKIGIITGTILSAYFAMNLIISGTILPNTYGAKVSYYSAEFRSRADFLKIEVWDYFTESAYMLLIFPFALAVIKTLTDIFHLKYNRNFLAVIFIFTLIFIYWYKLPYAHRFGRYLMPVIPFYILLFTYGSREFFKWFSKYLADKNLINGLNVMFLAAVTIYFGSSYYKNKELYQEQCRHIYIRQVLTAQWLKNNTPENSVIATHDVGAIAFYSERKIVDIVGLINPQFIPKLNTKEFASFVKEELKKQNVTHVAFLKEWFQVVNQPVLFKAGENGFEIMEVYEYFPGKTHILSVEVNNTLMYAGELLAKKQFQQALNVLNGAARADTNSSLTYYMLAYAYGILGDPVNTEKYLKRAIGVYPGYKEAAAILSNLYKSQNKIPDAKNVLSNYLQLNPSDTSVSKMLTELSNSDSDTSKVNK
ncbi:MAG: tetratricopeptide repeat protein [Chlorobi bacterium]|nr:tetratricopeptide repeat protein [Chlorobiota bacterium]MCI0715643.1 tetratricopeptide repeat protein [Chlorobiota bacterium]